MKKLLSGLLFVAVWAILYGVGIRVVDAQAKPTSVISSTVATVETEPLQGSGYLYIAGLTSNETLVTKATVAVAESAAYVLNGGGEQCEARLSNARAALDNPRQEAVAHFMWYIVLNTEVQANGENSSDALIKYVIDTYFAKVWGSCA